MTGTQCNFCFVTDDLWLGLFLVAAGQEEDSGVWVDAPVDKEKERRGKVKEEEMSNKSKVRRWEVCYYQGRNAR